MVWQTMCLNSDTTTSVLICYVMHTSFLSIVSVQPCAGRENKKWEKVEIIIFREIKVPGNIPVMQYMFVY